jgi:hypothetical protein
MLRSPCHLRRLLAPLLSLLIAGSAFAQTNQAVYTDSLQNGWLAWGWTKIDYASTAFVHSGAKAISVTITNNSYQAIYLHHPAQDSTYFTNLTFWIHGGTSGGQQLQVQAELDGVAQTAVSLPTLTTAWQQISISLGQLGAASQPNFDGVWIQDRVGSAQPTFYVDDITLIGGTPPPPPPPITNTPIAITIDALANRHPINPLIYGVAFASSNDLADLNCPLNRSGGNTTTRYNWQVNAANHAADWYFESLEGNSATPGGDGDSFVQDTKNGGAQPMLTVPMIGWVARLGPGRARLSSFSIVKYGLQADHDWQWFSDAGNGVITNTSTYVTGNDPSDASVLTDSTFQQGWIQHLTNRWNVSTNGGVRYYCMDNEHSLWHSTHRDVHPVGATMQEIRNKFFDYAAKVKAVDPAALVLAPEEWGWSGYLYSGYDQQWMGAHNDYNPADFPDRGTNGGWDYLPWFLNQARQQATNTNQRLLDYFTVHYYPQGGEYGSDTSVAMQLRRNRSTRSLWDTNYIDDSWINSVVKLIPRLKGWVTNYYPNTRIGITEYNWGAEDHINGATAQADVLGIFGREGLDLATRWTTPAASTPTYKAMKLFRNYDGNHSGFGDTSVLASVPNPDTLSAFAAVASTNGALTIIVINKQLTNTQPVAIALSNYVANGTAQVWQLTSSNVISRLPDITFSGTTLSNSVPAQSITLFVLPARNALRLRNTVMNAGSFDFWIDAQSNQPYVIQSSSNLLDWLPLQTNTPASNSFHVTLPATSRQRFYRAQWLP